ncbi:MAG: hypothetical protein H3Z52_10870 [archaeon]|nr:hypothetical protein [archaeon]
MQHIDKHICVEDCLLMDILLSTEAQIKTTVEEFLKVLATKNVEVSVGYAKFLSSSSDNVCR